MLPAKVNFNCHFSSIIIGSILLLSTLATTRLVAQDQVDLKLSAGASAGYTIQATLGSNKQSGVVFGVYGELEYGQIMGRLQFTKRLENASKDDKNLDGGEAYHGSLGYRFDFSDKFSLALLASGGATVIHYSNGFGGSSGDQFTNVSPQVGINVVPIYHIGGPLSVQASLRYYKGFEAGDRGRASNLADVSVGLRFSL